MVKPGVNHVLRRPRDLRNARMRRAPTSPNSPRESAVGVVMPRAMRPDWVSKSKVRHTMWRDTAAPLGRKTMGATAMIAIFRRRQRAPPPPEVASGRLDKPPAGRALQSVQNKSPAL